MSLEGESLRVASKTEQSFAKAATREDAETKA